MIYPFDEEKRITWSYKEHLRAGGIYAQTAGVDFDARGGINIYAIQDGIVQSAKDQFGGLYLRLFTETDEWQFVHLGEVYKEGVVKQGDLIAKSGVTGLMTGEVVHIGYIKNGVRTDPTYLILASLEFMRKQITNFRKEVQFLRGEGKKQTTEIKRLKSLLEEQGKLLEAKEKTYQQLYSNHYETNKNLIKIEYENAKLKEQNTPFYDKINMFFKHIKNEAIRKIRK